MLFINKLRFKKHLSAPRRFLYITGGLPLCGLLFCACSAPGRKSLPARTSQSPPAAGTVLFSSGRKSSLPPSLQEKIKQSDLSLKEKTRLVEFLRQNLAQTQAALQEQGSDTELALAQRGDFSGAQVFFQKQIPLKVPESGLRNYHLGNLALADLDFTTAAGYYTKAAFLVRDNARYLHCAAYTLGLSGQHREALSYLEKALQFETSRYGDSHPKIAATLEKRAEHWQALGEYERLIECYERILTIDRPIYGKKHPKIAALLSQLGATWKSTGDYTRAADYFEGALAINREVYGDRNVRVGQSLVNLGKTWDALGEYQKSKEAYGQVLTIYRRIYGDHNPRTAVIFNVLGETCKSLGDREKAREYVAKAYRIFSDTLGKNHPYTKRTGEDLQALTN